MAGFGGFSAAAAQSLKNNRSMRRERGAYFKERNKETQRYVVPKASYNSHLSKQEMENRYHQKLWKTWVIIGAAVMIFTWWLVQNIDL
ncbi:MAG: hypothetical protein AAF806_09825 [Bacteroidota bacterium]